MHKSTVKMLPFIELPRSYAVVLSGTANVADSASEFVDRLIQPRRGSPRRLVLRLGSGSRLNPNRTSLGRPDVCFHRLAMVQVCFNNRYSEKGSILI